MLQLGQKVRCISNPSDRNRHVLTVGDIYRIDNIKDDKIHVSYLDGYLPHHFRRTGFDPALFRPMPKKCIAPIGGEVMLVDSSGGFGFMRLADSVEQGKLTLYQKYKVIDIKPNEKDVIMITNNRGKKIWVYTDSFILWQPVKSRIPAWL